MSSTLTYTPALQRNVLRSSTTLVRLADALPDGIVLFDMNWRLMYANQSARVISGLEDSDMHRSHWEIWPETVGTSLETVYWTAMNDRCEKQLAAFFFAPRSQWFDIWLYPVDGGIAIYYRDITEERRLQKANVDVEERTRKTLTVAGGIGAWEWDLSSDTFYADHEFARLHGLDGAEAGAGMRFATFLEHVHPDDERVVAMAFQTARRVKRLSQVEYRLHEDEGPSAWRAVHGQCTYDEKGELLRLTGVAVDISGRKQAEAALVRSEKLAAVGRMASSMAHEINNPLESVTNLLFLAQQNSVSPEVKRYLSLASQELERINVIANHTLRFHKQATVPRTISPASLFSMVTSLYESRLRNAGIIVRTRIQPDLTFACFEGDLRQVLNNLVSNAIDAMPHGGILQLRSRRARHAGTGRPGVLLTVADTGCGIHALDRQRIFDPFFTTKDGNGNGLGLWIAKDVLDRHNGVLAIRSRSEGQPCGTVASIFLPVAANTATPKPLSEAMMTDPLPLAVSLSAASPAMPLSN